MKFLIKNLFSLSVPLDQEKLHYQQKIAALLKEKYSHKSISVASLSKSNLEHNKMSAFARVLNIPSIFIENDIDENSFAKMKDFDTMVIDINLEPEEACEKIKTLNKIIGVNEKIYIYEYRWRKFFKFN